MKYVDTNVDGQMVMKISESLTFADHQSFRDMLKKLEDGKHKSCCFDISELVSIDSAGLGMFLIAKDHSQQHGWQMTIKGPQGQVGSVMKLAKFEDIFTIIN